MSLLSDYITGKISFPSKHTGIPHDSWNLKEYKRKEKNIVYKCSFCDCDILPNDFMNVHTERGKIIEIPNVWGDGTYRPWEVLGFTCKKCFDEISEYDNLYYG